MSYILANVVKHPKTNLESCRNLVGTLGRFRVSGSPPSAIVVPQGAAITNHLGQGFLAQCKRMVFSSGKYCPTMMGNTCPLLCVGHVSSQFMCQLGAAT